MRIVRFFLKHSRKIVLLSVCAGVLSGAFNASLLAVINTAIKAGTRPMMLVLGYCGLCLLLPLSRFTAELLLTRLGQESMYKLRMQLCGQVLDAPLRHLEQLGPPRILACLGDDIPSVTNAVSAIPLLCVNAALVIGCLIYIATLSLIVFGLVLLFMLIGIVSYQLPIIKVQKLFMLSRKTADTLQDHFQALTHGVKELKIHSGRREAFVKDGLDAAASSLQRYNTSGLKLYAAAASWGQTLVFVVVGLVIFLLPAVRQLNAPTLIGYTLTLLYLMTPLQVILNGLPAMSRANIALQKVEDLGLTLDQQGSEVRADMNGQPVKWNKLEVKGITHRYHREDEVDDFVLGPIDVEFKPGELIFIVGGNGSGKTTLLKLLTGLYAPEEGTIHLDGRPVDGEGREVYRQHFSVVFSDFYLFEQMLGLIGPETDKQAREYLAQLKLSQKVEIKDGKLSTIGLSQGQRKRLALLTAYLEDRPIYVFDEWAADQDPHFKSVFYMQLLPELKAKGKTVFVISHDDRYYHVADRIIKLDEGKVVSDTANGAASDHRYTAEVRAAI